MTSIIDRLLALNLLNDAGGLLVKKEEIEFESIKKQLEEMEVKADKYDKWFKNNTLLGTALQEAIKTKHQNRILKSGLEEILKDSNTHKLGSFYWYECVREIRKLLEKVNKK